jgi:hypothetical protein
VLLHKDVRRKWRFSELQRYAAVNDKCPGVSSFSGVRGAREPQKLLKLQTKTSSCHSDATLTLTLPITLSSFSQSIYSFTQSRCRRTATVIPCYNISSPNFVLLLLLLIWRFGQFQSHGFPTAEISTQMNFYDLSISAPHRSNFSSNTTSFTKREIIFVLFLSFPRNHRSYQSPDSKYTRTTISLKSVKNTVEQWKYIPHYRTSRFPSCLLRSERTLLLLQNKYWEMRFLVIIVSFVLPE